MRNPPSVFIKPDGPLKLKTIEDFRDRNPAGEVDLPFNSFMGQIKVKIRPDGSVRYHFTELDDERPQYETPLEQVAIIEPITRNDKEIYAIYLQSCFYKFAHPISEGEGNKTRYPFQLANQTPFLSLIFSPKGILDESLKLDPNLISDVYRNHNFIQYLFFDTDLAQIFSNHFREGLQNLDENTKKDLLKSILNFEKGGSKKPLFFGVEKLESDSGELGIVINDFAQTQSQKANQLEVLREIIQHRDRKSSFLELLLKKQQYKAITRVVDIASSILIPNSDEIKNEIEGIFDLKKLFSSRETLNLLKKEDCKNLFAIFDIIEDPLQKKQYFEEVFLANNEAFIEKILREDCSGIIDDFFAKMKEIYGEEQCNEFIEKSRNPGNLFLKIINHHSAGDGQTAGVRPRSRGGFDRREADDFREYKRPRVSGPDSALATTAPVANIESQTLARVPRDSGEGFSFPLPPSSVAKKPSTIEIKLASRKGDKIKKGT